MWVLLSALLVVFVAAAVGTRMMKKSHFVGSYPELETPLRALGATSAPARTVAVLPFDNISADAADAYPVSYTHLTLPTILRV